VKVKEVPQVQVVLADLSPYFSTFYSAFEAASHNGRGYFEERSLNFDRWLYADLVRHWVKEALNQNALKAEYEPQDLGNSGIQLMIKQWFVRVRKSLNGEVPLPGRSKRLQGYYRQLPLSEEFSDMYNLLLLWNTTPAGDFKNLSLVYPIAAGVAKWRVEIPHPAQVVQMTTLYQTEFDALGNLDIEPLGDDEENGLVEAQ
jgi:hypothetical protein